MINAIVINTTLLQVSAEFLNRMLDGRSDSRLRVYVTDCEFG